MLVDDRALQLTHERFRPVQRTGCLWMLVGARAPPWTHERFLHVQRRTGCSRMLVDARDIPWLHERFLPVQRTGCSWMLVLSHGPMSDSYLCSAHGTRG